MSWSKLQYISGYQTKLTQSALGYIEAGSLQEALRLKSDWPIDVRYNCTSAWAKNPGTSLYVVEAWEADCCILPAESKPAGSQGEMNAKPVKSGCIDTDSAPFVKGGKHLPPAVGA